MSKLLKRLIVDEFDKRFGEIEDAVIIGCPGLTAEEDGDFRKTLRDAGASVSVVKNTLARHVFSKRGCEFDEGCFQGPTAIVYGVDAVSTSKILADWRKKNKKQVPFKGGLLQGEALSGNQAEGLTDLPSVEEIKQMLVSAVAGPLTSMVGITSNILSGVPAVLQAIADKQSEGE